MAMRVPSTSDTFGGRLSAELAAVDSAGLLVGVDYQENRREAIRYAGPRLEMVEAVQSILWPEVRIRQLGLFVEGEGKAEAPGLWRYGLRLDRNTASAASANDGVAGMNWNPARLYFNYYGESKTDWSDTAVSGLLRYERTIGDGRQWFAGISRSVRSPDATERFLAGGSPKAAMRWVGNPGLDPARHHQLDLGLSGTGDRSSWTFSVFADEGARLRLARSGSGSARYHLD